ncbi:MAG: Sulfite exporter tauE/safE-like protein [Rhodobacteraceae bacterium]|uniref:sulfite exporter TauE/SafE family protein n=1 Tax=Cypionkella sp. TaxID=2811411 RepID=UPI0013243692|nr:sulfite exporter TauE/SafE family protein [Cypionkella sp.]KAF0173396.1 MAG: Sulfite exporter tauE/safE-like protein [Paracoccaceae bacterium]MDO8325845.1 sulfite exporter TauE/SafE family protein [Cypionkella sp.]
MTLPFEMGVGAAAYMAVAILLSAFVRGYSGFGFSALVISASGLVTNPLHFVAVVVLCEALMSVQAWRGIGAFVDWRRVWLLLAGAAVGMPLGLWALTSISEDAARAVISGYVLLMCLILLAGWRLGRELRGPANFWAGIASGLANAPGMGGLPVVAFFAAQSMQANVFRATLVAYFPLLDIYAAPLYFYSGLVSWDTLWASLLALPMVFLGNWLGSRHFLNTDPQDFRKFAIGLLALLATLGLLKSVL